MCVHCWANRIQAASDVLCFTLRCKRIGGICSFCIAAAMPIYRERKIVSRRAVVYSNEIILWDAGLEGGALGIDGKI